MGSGFEIMAPWVPILKNAVSYELETNPFISFQFSNIETIKSKDIKTNEEITMQIPRIRTVVYRGFLFNNFNSNVILFTTDKRSNKYKQLMKDPNYEACYWFPKSNIQLRLSGTVKVITEDITPKLKIAKNINTDGKPFYKLSKEFVGSGADVEIDASASNISLMPNIVSNPQDLDPESPVLEQLEQMFPTKNYSIDDAINFKIISPNQLSKLDQSTTSLFQLGQQKPEELIPPTKEEWLDERERVFQNLSRTIKKSFFKPQPGTLLNDSNARLLDSIRRGVDGKNYHNLKEMDNFVVVCMFVNLVDYVDFNNDRRIIYKRFESGAWKEFEVCP